MNYKVPFLSQITDVSDKDWQYRACGVTSLSMIMGFWHSHDKHNRNSTPNELVQVGVRIGAYIENIGWSHPGLVNIAREFGYDGHNYDLHKVDIGPAWESMLADLAKYPLLASVYPELNPKLGGGHVVVICGFENGKLLVNDPEKKDTTTGHRTLTKEDFLHGWKKRYIEIYPGIK